MIAIDTNVVVRFLANDHPDQSQRARQVMLDGDIFLPISVCLETEWVLRSVYQASREQIAQKLAELFGMQGVTVEDPEVLAMAIGWFRQGMDFADALHLASAEDCEAMVSFDARFAAAAQRLGTLAVRLP